MIHIQNLTVKNFMSVGNSTQGINFDRNDLTLVLGENLDLAATEVETAQARQQLSTHSAMRCTEQHLAISVRITWSTKPMPKT